VTGCAARAHKLGRARHTRRAAQPGREIAHDVCGDGGRSESLSQSESESKRRTRSVFESSRALLLIGEHCASAATRCRHVLAAWASRCCHVLSCTNLPNPLLIVYAKVPRSSAVKKGDKIATKDGWSIVHDSAQPYRVTSMQVRLSGHIGSLIAAFIRLKSRMGTIFRVHGSCTAYRTAQCRPAIGPFGFSRVALWRVGLAVRMKDGLLRHQPLWTTGMTLHRRSCWTRKTPSTFCSTACATARSSASASTHRAAVSSMLASSSRGCAAIPRTVAQCSASTVRGCGSHRNIPIGRSDPKADGRTDSCAAHLRECPSAALRTTSLGWLGDPQPSFVPIAHFLPFAL
jgi:hypothetical protein